MSHAFRKKRFVRTGLLALLSCISIAILVPGIRADIRNRHYGQAIASRRFFMHKPEIHSKENDNIRKALRQFLVYHMDGHFSSAISIVSDSVFRAYEYVDSLAKQFYYAKARAYPTFGADKEMLIVPTTADDFRFQRSVDSVGNGLMNHRLPVTAWKGLFRDKDLLTDEWLNDHIEVAVDNWKHSPYARGLRFEEFKETMLPYRFKNEALSVPTSYIRQMLQPIVGKSRGLAQAVFDINSYTFYVDCLEDEGQPLGQLGYFDILDFYKFECGRHSEWMARALNAVGIPTVMDFTPNWAARDRGHYWVASRGLDGKYYPFTPKWQTLYDLNYFKDVTKVFRFTYDRQRGPCLDRKSGEDVPEVFDTPYIRDVTRYYHSVVNLKAAIHGKGLNKRFLYLCVFESRGWQPVGWGKINEAETEVAFRDVPRNAAYIIGSYDDGRIEALGKPFFIDNDAKIIEMVPDGRYVDVMRLKKKFYDKPRLVNALNETDGTRILGSGSRDFLYSRLLGNIRAAGFPNFTWGSIPVLSTKPVSYIQLQARDDKSKFHLSEIKVFGYSGQSYLGGTNPHEVPLTPLEDADSIRKLFDGNVETFVSKGQQTFELAKPTIISSIDIAVRTANNGIVPGNAYELFYFDRKWKSAGRKRAVSEELVFGHIPSGTIYWLRNLTAGKEEQAFQYVNGRQIFLNFDKFVKTGAE